MTGPMLLWLLCFAVVVGGVVWVLRRSVTTPRLYSTQKQLQRIQRARERKARDVRNEQLIYQIDQNGDAR